MMVEKNSVSEGVVSSLGTGGEGVIRLEGYTAFVPFCLKGERVRFKALKVTGGVIYGKLQTVLSFSPERVQPQCPVFGKCGGCSLQHMSYPAQLAFKRELVSNALKKIGGIEAEAENTVPCASPYRYRNKLAMPLGADTSGGLCAGFYAPLSHRIVPVDDCPIQSERTAEIISIVKKYASICKLRGYDERARTGDLRRVAVRNLGGKLIIALVAARPVNTDVLCNLLSEKFEDYTLLLNINDSRANAIFSDNWRICRGDGLFYAEESGVKFSAGANTFVQVNDQMRSKLYAAILKEAEGVEAAVDLYSGGGLLTAMLAKKCGKAYGVELVKEASERADALCKDNDLSGKMFNICGKTEEKLDEVLSKTEGLNRVIVCDPPRKGMERSVAFRLKECRAQKLLLVSCDPATLARDLGIITGALGEGENGSLKKQTPADGGWRVTSVTPFDMFPQTRHVETLAVLSRN